MPGDHAAVLILGDPPARSAYEPLSDQLWQYSRTYSRSDDSYLQQSDQGLGVPAHLVIA